MQLLSVHPGVSVQEACEASAFELLVAPHIETTSLPSAEELNLLAEIDPMGISVGK